MTGTLKFELVAPERKLAEAEPQAVRIPAQEGELTAMPQHAPLLTTLRPGFVILVGAEEARYFVTGGFAEIGPEGVAVLAEEAVPEDELTRDWLDERISREETKLAEVGDERRQIVDQRLRDLRAAAEAA